jgi:oxygen-independent coproporphyrinogen-3 oxidase
MGYTVQFSKNLLGFGPSSLSSIDEAFAQNEKEYKEWKQLINDNHSPIIHGHVLSSEELKKRKMIMDLMCHFKTKADITELPDWQKQNLAALSKDHLIEVKNDSLMATELGKMFIRNICMAIDDTYRPQNRHSSSI